MKTRTFYIIESMFNGSLMWEAHKDGLEARLGIWAFNGIFETCSFSSSSGSIAECERRLRRWAETHRIKPKIVRTVQIPD